MSLLVLAGVIDTDAPDISVQVEVDVDAVVPDVTLLSCICCTPTVGILLSLINTPSIVTPEPDVVSLIVFVEITEPDNAVKSFAVIWKSSAFAILISIWSSVSAVILVSASASIISSVPLF